MQLSAYDGYVQPAKAQALGVSRGLEIEYI